MAANWSTSQVLNQLNSGSRWSVSTITYAFPSTPGGMYSQGEATGFRPANAAQQALMTLALSTWDDLIPQSVAPGTVGSTNIEFGYTSTNIGYAHAYQPQVGSAWFNANESSLVSTDIGQYGFQTFIHEIGHALGLNHMGDYNGDGNWSPSSFQDSVVLSIMSYFGPRRAAPNYSAEVMQADWEAGDGQTYSPQTPMLNDILAIQTIYGISQTTRADNTVYGFGSTVGGATARIYNFATNRNPVLTIFDSGGTDTLNLSGWNTPSTVDLAPGAFSSANQMTSNIAIAYNTTIENAVGGAGNDVIRGNDAANRLEGGAGSDELYGLAGDDTLVGGAGNDKLDGGAGTDTAVFEGSFGSYTISVSGNSVTVSGTASGTDQATGIERFQFADSVRTLAELVPGADSTPPQLQTLSPADNAGAVSPSANLVLTFNEAVKAGAGSITIYNSDGSLLRTIAATDGAQVSFSGSSVIVDPAANLTAGRSYYVQVAANAITDLAGNAYGGIATATTWNFTVAASDTTPPQLQSLAPADDSANVTASANLVMQFDEPVSAGSGNITLRSGTQVLRTIAIGDTSQVSISGATVTINPAADLPTGSAVSVTVDSGALRDAAGNAYGGISAQTTWNFTVAATSGDDYAHDTGTTGVVTVNGAATSGVIETIDDMDLFRVQLSAGVNYTFSLQRSASGLPDPYLRLYDPSLRLVAEDDDSGGAGNAQIGYTATSSGTYYLDVLDYGSGIGGYTVRASAQDSTPPTLVSRSPADDAFQVSVGADLVMTFSEAVTRGSGTIRLLNANGVVVREIRADDTSAVSVNGSTVTVDPGANLPSGSAFSVNIESGAFRDLSGNAFAGISGTTAWNFTTAVPSGTDDYPLSVNTPGLVTPGGAFVSARIDSPDDGDLFRVNLVAGVTYRFDMSSPISSAVDPYLVLYGPKPDVQLMAYDDDSGPVTLDARIYFTPSRSGEYFLAAFDYAEATGAYTVSAIAPVDDYLGSTSTLGRVSAGTPGVSAKIDAPSDIDFFAVTLTSGQQYTFDLVSTGLDDPYLLLYDAAGTALAYDDDTGVDLDAQITFTAPSSGTYYLGATDYDVGTGTYSISGFVRVVKRGTAGNDTLNGDSGSETLDSGAGNDLLRGGTGNDILFGGDGIDTGRYAGAKGNYFLEHMEGGGWVVRDLVGSEGRDLAYDVERLQFDGGSWALDIDGNAGTAAKILGAVFGAASLSNATYVGIGLGLLDAGWSYPALMKLALDARLGPNASNAAVVNLLYANLFGSQPSTDTRLFYEGLISSGAYTQATLAVAAAETEFNATNIDLVGLDATGIGYI